MLEHEEKAEKFLAYLVHSKVISLHGPHSQQITDPSVVSSMFRDFFVELYTSTRPVDEGPMNSFFEGITLQRLKADQIGLLEAPPYHRGDSRCYCQVC